MINDNREYRTVYLEEMNSIGIRIHELIAKMTSSLTDYDSVLELQKAANHLAIARTISFYNDKIEDEIDKENE